MPRKKNEHEKAMANLMRIKRHNEKAQGCLPKGSEYLGFEEVILQTEYCVRPQKFMKVFYNYQGKSFYTHILAQGWR